jgi:hypothetical protein
MKGLLDNFDEETAAPEDCAKIARGVTADGIGDGQTFLDEICSCGFDLNRCNSSKQSGVCSEPQ